MELCYTQSQISPSSTPRARPLSMCDVSFLYPTSWFVVCSVCCWKILPWHCWLNVHSSSYVMLGLGLLQSTQLLRVDVVLEEDDWYIIPCRTLMSSVSVRIWDIKLAFSFWFHICKMDLTACLHDRWTRTVQNPPFRCLAGGEHEECRAFPD